MRDNGDGVRLLLVEDERPLARVLTRGLQRIGHTVDHVADGRAALELAEGTTPFDLLILDIGIPGPDGLTVLRHLREVGDERPVLLLTGRGDVSDRVAGLRAGADDYLPKPFVLEELAARIEALVRRRRHEQHAVLTSGSLVLDPAAHTVERHGQAVELTGREFDLLEYLVRNQGQVLTREQLLDRVWGIRDGEDESNLVSVYVKYLRDKVDRPFGVTSLSTVRGVGYRWDSDS